MKKSKRKVTLVTREHGEHYLSMLMRTRTRQEALKVLRETAEQQNRRQENPDDGSPRRPHADSEFNMWLRNQEEDLNSDEDDDLEDVGGESKRRPKRRIRRRTL